MIQKQEPFTNKPYRQKQLATSFAPTESLVTKKRKKCKLKKKKKDSFSIHNLSYKFKVGKQTILTKNHEQLTQDGAGEEEKKKRKV